MSDDPVHRQYEAYPYPARDPADEGKRLVTGSPSQLFEVNHYLFGGKRNFSEPFRALVAGGGTGDAAIMLAQQLADTGGPGEVVYLDLSAASRRIAEARAQARGLENIRFLTGAIEDLAGLGIGRFDYIDCCGVLHHLAEPAAGLQALVEALDEAGGLGLMVYGAYGRTGVYPMQEMLRSLGGDLPLDRRVALARRLLGALPPTNWLKRNPYLGDHEENDAGLVDLFLHARDRAYTVAQAAELAAAAGLEVVAFIEPARYDPASYLDDAKLLAPLDDLGRIDRAAFAEALAGNMKKHVFYVARADTAKGRIARAMGPEAVPRLARGDGRRLAEGLRRKPVLAVTWDGLKRRFALPPLGPEILAGIDGRTSLGEIHRTLRKRDPGLDWLAFKAAYDAMQEVLGGLNLLWVTYPAARE